MSTRFAPASTSDRIQDAVEPILIEGDAIWQLQCGYPQRAQKLAAQAARHFRSLAQIYTHEMDAPAEWKRLQHNAYRRAAYQCLAFGRRCDERSEG